MFANSQYHHTPVQLVALETGVAVARASFRSLFAQARVLHDSLVAAGTLNEDGTTVRNGANRDVMNVYDRLVAAALSLSTLIDRDYADMIRYEFHHVNDSFVSAERMNAEFKHCLALIPVYRARYGEGLPLAA